MDRRKDSIKEDRAKALSQALGWIDECKREIAEQDERLTNLIQRITEQMAVIDEDITN